MAPIMPSTPEEQASFLLRTIIPYLKNDLDSIADSRCPTHARGGGGPAFSLTVMSLAACEVIAELDGVGKGPKDRRRTIFGDIARLANDPRYIDLGEILFVIFRHGIAHTFLPKGAADVVGMTIWNNDTDNKSLCIEKVKADLMGYRSWEHLRLDIGALIVDPQVLYLDIATLLNDYEQRLRTQDASTFSRLAVNFPLWWADNARIDAHALNNHEWELVKRQKEVTPLLVSNGPTLMRGADRAEFQVFRIQRGFRVTTTLNGVATDESVVDRSEADEYVFSRALELRNSGFDEVVS